MNTAYVIAGTDTNVGKTIVSALLALALDANYFKPIQSGTPTDSEFMREVLGAHRVFDEHYLFSNPLSPNQAAELESKEIDLKSIEIEKKRAVKNLIIETAGGILSPLNSQHSVLDLLCYLRVPVILVARSGLGTINHTLQTVTLLAQHDCLPRKIILCGAQHDKNLRDIELRTGISTIYFDQIKNCNWERQ